jgi:hypothetical protein
MTSAPQARGDVGDRHRVLWRSVQVHTVWVPDRANSIGLFRVWLFDVSDDGRLRQIAAPDPTVLPCSLDGRHLLAAWVSPAVSAPACERAVRLFARQLERRQFLAAAGQTR